MVGGKYKSRKYRKTYRKTPGGRCVVHYSSRKAERAKCFKCGRALQGSKLIATSHEGFLPKTAKGVSRIFGGSLCGICAKEILKTKARSI